MLDSLFEKFERKYIKGLILYIKEIQFWLYYIGQSSTNQFFLLDNLFDLQIKESFYTQEDMREQNQVL